MSENVVFNLKKNAVAELFFKSLKAEWAYKYNKWSEAELSIQEFEIKKI
ncbi:MAG: hypothetical protein HRT69_18065 [Flavobacteriaceae bacterium]|nr:hypothetical protein [Flavobacteriaceae bacterium]